MTRAIITVAMLALAAPAWAGTLTDCSIDGRLKGVKIGSALWRKQIATFPGGRCIATGPNGTFIADAHGVRRLVGGGQ